MHKDKKKGALEWLSSTWGRFWTIIAAGVSLGTLLVNIFHWDTEKTLAVICFGCFILILAGTMVDRRGDENAEKIDQISEMLTEIRCDTLRIQLSMAMRHQPTNIEMILKLAQIYFVDLDGDWVTTNEFLTWAKEHGVIVPTNIANAIANNDHK